MHYHLVGIGGIGMSAIAQLLLRRGKKVSGSDLRYSGITRELEALGAQLFIGHDAAHVSGADVVVYSSAIKEDNPELAEAKRCGIRIIKRAEALAGLMEDKTVVTVTGSHGKTTTASLVSYLLLEAGLRPTLAVGGIHRNIESNATLGDGRFFVAEADESDGSFLFYHPDYSIITNVDHEHLDYYRDFQGAVSAFRQFLENTKKGGSVFACWDDMVLRDICKGFRGRCLSFGLLRGAQIRAERIEFKGLGSEFDCFLKDRLLGRFRLSLGGAHNVSNALSVIGLGCELGIDIASIQRTLSNYKGSKRRLEVKFLDDNYQIIDDYAHHPTEIRATLAALGNLVRKRMIAVFQPHRFTRTKALSDEFAKSFDLADYVVVTDIYPAGEPPLEGVSARRIYDRIREGFPQKQVCYMAKEEIVTHLVSQIKPGDLIVTLGAGDISKICDELVETVKRKS